ncbi:piwi-like protein Siwi isoform X2 [Rhynchophorus ferrugineus]|uniref:piwi-like protein Siwi isoform X2 n=1 Tax=Rhynchophorus ferrugineus TaxID=354439 RepID=UPI003FCE456C
MHDDGSDGETEREIPADEVAERTYPYRINCYDVCRNTANKGKGFAGMVASIDVGCIDCKHLQTRNGVYAERIVVYRDGVSDGQMKYVKEHEVELLKNDLFKNRPRHCIEA